MGGEGREAKGKERTKMERTERIRVSVALRGPPKWGRMDGYTEIRTDVTFHFLKLQFPTKILALSIKKKRKAL